MPQASLVASMTEPVTETSWREWLSLRGRKERQVTGRRSLNSRREVRVNRNIDSHEVAVLVLRLNESNAVVSDMLGAEPYRILPPARCVEHERHRQMCPGAERMPSLESVHVLQRPGMVSFFQVLDRRNVTGWIAHSLIVRERPLEKGATADPRMNPASAADGSDVST
jgi:hypothetical protein